MPRVLITDSIAEEGIKVLKDNGFEVHLAPEMKGEKLKTGIKGYEVLVVRSATKVTKEIIESADVLKVIGRAGVGLDNIDLNTAKRKGITVLNTPEATAISVAELTIGLIFASLRGIAFQDRSIRSGTWAKKSKGSELFGKTVGIIGLGRIGTEVAKRLNAFGAQIVAYDPFVKDSQYARLVPLEELLITSDIITLHLPLNENTKNFINSNRISMMKDGVIMINTSRGGILNEESLIQGLKTGKIKACGLDVYETEPLPPNHPLLNFDQVVLTSHIGAQTVEGQIRAAVDLAQKIVNTFKS